VAESVASVFEGLVRRMQEPLGLDRWDIKVISEADPENTAGCSARPWYQQATIYLDPDRLETGDELDETAAHESAHCHVWPIAKMADDLAVAMLELLPEPFVAPWAKMLKAQVEQAEEATTTQVGRTYVRLLRRLWAAEKEMAGLKAEIKQLRKG
jgi:hypothetical protein